MRDPGVTYPWVASQRQAVTRRSTHITALAATLLAASLAAVVVQFLATLFAFGAVSTLGWSAAVFPAVIVLAGIAMLQLAKSAAGRGWIV